MALREEAIRAILDPQDLFGPLALGDILEDALRFHRTSLVVEGGFAFAVDMSFLAVGADDAIVGTVVAAHERLPRERLDPLAILGMDKAQKVIVRRHTFARLQPV